MQDAFGKIARAAPQLRELRLNDSGASETRAAALRPLLTALTALYAAHNGNLARDALAVLARMPQLRVLDLHRTMNVDDRCQILVVNSNSQPVFR